MVVYFVTISTDCQIFFIDVNFLLACRNVTTNVVEILSQSSGQLVWLVGLLFVIPLTDENMKKCITLGISVLKIVI